MTDNIDFGNSQRILRIFKNYPRFIRDGYEKKLLNFIKGHVIVLPFTDLYLDNIIFFDSSFLNTVLLSQNNNIKLICFFDRSAFNEVNLDILAENFKKFYRFCDCKNLSFLKTSTVFLEKILTKKQYPFLSFFDDIAFTDRVVGELIELYKNDQLPYITLPNGPVSKVLFLDLSFFDLYIENIKSGKEKDYSVLTYFDASLLDKKRLCDLYDAYKFALKNDGYVLDKIIDDKKMNEFLAKNSNNKECDELEKKNILFLNQSFWESSYLLSIFIDNDDFEYFPNFDIKAFSFSNVINLYNTYNSAFLQSFSYRYKDMDFLFDHIVRGLKRSVSIDDFMEAMELSDYVKALLLLCIFNRENIDCKNEIDLFLNEVSNGDTKLYKLLKSYITLVLNGKRNPLNFSYIINEIRFYFDNRESNTDSFSLIKILPFVIACGDVSSSAEALEIKSIPFGIINNINSNRLGKLISLLKEKNICSDYSSLALKMSILIGFDTAVLLLQGKYGNVDEKFLLEFFSPVKVVGIRYAMGPQGMMPVVNNQLLNLLFGYNYKTNNTLIKNYLNNYEYKKLEQEKIIGDKFPGNNYDKVEHDVFLAKLGKEFYEYKNLCENFIKNFWDINRKWDAIVLEFHKLQNLSNLNLKLNLSLCYQLYSKVSMQDFIPELEVQDWELMDSKVFDYACVDNQYVSNVKDVPKRIVYLSRQMSNVFSKRFPFISLSNENYTLRVFHPQDRNFLCAGYKTHNCMRPNGVGDDTGDNNSLLYYCTATEFGGGVEIVDKDENLLAFLPLLRNGNVLLLHSIEGDNLSTEQISEINNLICEYGNKVINESEKIGDNIEFVFLGDLKNIDYHIIKKKIPSNKKFEVYDYFDEFEGMYTNIDENDQLVVASKKGRSYKDICYGFPGKSYVYPTLQNYVYYLKIDERSLDLINSIMTLEKSISNITEEYIDECNECIYLKDDLLNRYLILKDEQTRVRNEFYIELLKNNKGIDLYKEFLRAIKCICALDGCKIEFIYGVEEIYYSRDWYLYRTNDGLWFANAIPSAINDLRKQITKVLDNTTADILLKKLNK